MLLPLVFFVRMALRMHVIYLLLALSLDLDSIADNFESLVEWFFNTQDKETMGKISDVLRAIWRQLNDQYWNGSHESAEITVYLALECLFYWISI